MSKRHVKAPKIYIKDSGLLHGLLSIGSLLDLEKHPKIGASWEGFVLGEILHHLDIERRDAYFWATHAGAELDLLVFVKGKPIGFEIKRSVSPKVTPSMRVSISDLELDILFVIHAGDHEFQMDEKTFAIPKSKLESSLARLMG